MQQERDRSGWAVGWTGFAAFMMLMIGTFHAIAGLAGILEDEVYVATPKYIFEFDATAWGWIHLILGIVVVLALRPVQRRGLGPNGRRDPGRTERDRELRVHPVVSAVVDHDHRGRRGRDLGADGTRARYHDERVSTSPTTP